MPLPIPSGTLDRLERQAGRVHEIVRVLVKYQLAGWLSRIPLPKITELLSGSEGAAIRDLSREVRIRLAVSELGPTFIKVGQMLSTRADIVGVALAQELTKLQSQTPPDPTEQIWACIVRELGSPPEELFESFDPNPFASASIAQVHHAKLKSGENVVIKVQKDGIEDKILSDLSILTTAAELVEKHMPELQSYHPVQLVHQFRRSLLNELDFSRERKNLEAFGRNFEDDDYVRFPKPFAEFSSGKVLAMEFLDGMIGSDLATLKESGEDLGEFARRGASAFLDMIFRDSFYHADPHPGNLMLLPGHVVGIIDCGMVGRLDEGLHDDFETLMLAVSQGDAEILTDTMWQLCNKPIGVSREQLRAELSDFLAEATQSSLGEIDLGHVLNQLTEIIRKYRMTIQPGLATLLKTLVVLEGTAQLLNPQFSLAEVMQPYNELILRQRFNPEKLSRRLQRSTRDWDRILQTFPRDLTQTMQSIQAGKFQIRIEHTRLESTTNRIVLGLLISAFVLSSAILLSFKAPPLIGDLSIFGSLGYLCAGYLGYRLLRSIDKWKDPQ